MRREVIVPDELAPPRGFNHAILTEGGQTVYLAGQDATGPDGEIVAPGDLVAQFEQVMSNLAAVCEAAGGSSEDIVKLNVFVDDATAYRDHLGEVGEIFQDYIDEYPAMALFEVSRFYKPEALIEMEGFAVIDDGA